MDVLHHVRAYAVEAVVKIVLIIVLVHVVVVEVDVEIITKSLLCQKLQFNLTIGKMVKQKR